MVPLIFLGGTIRNIPRVGSRNVPKTGDQIVLEFRLVLQSEFEKRIRAAEGKLLADVVAVIFDCAVVDKQLCSD